MRRRITYVLGGPIQEEVESRKRCGAHPRAEFNLFVLRNGANLVGTDAAAPGSPTSLRRRVALARLLSRECSDYDVLVASGEDIGIPLALLSLAQRTTKPIWMFLHGSYLESSKFKMISPVLRRARHVGFLCLSEALRSRMIDAHGFSPERCPAVGYAVDTLFFRPGEAVRTPLIVAAGSANRDYQTLVSAVRDLDVPVRIAADSLWRPKASTLGRTLLPTGVEVGSAGDYVALRRLYEQASFVVVPLHPARHASGYAVIAEAMAMGKAVITTRTEASSDLVIDGTTGFYVEPGDAAGLRGRIRSLLRDPQYAQAMGKAAGRRMREFSLEAYCLAVERLIGAEAPDGCDSRPQRFSQ